MRVRPQRRRNLVVWNQSAGTDPASRVTRPTRTRRIRRWIRIGMRLTLLGLLPLARAVRSRWKLLLAGTVLTVTGVIMGASAAGSTMLLPGLMLLMAAPLVPGSPGAERTKLERELAGYCTNAQRLDLAATLDRYPDDATCEVREILASQAAAAYDSRSGAIGRH